MKDFYIFLNSKKVDYPCNSKKKNAKRIFWSFSTSFIIILDFVMDTLVILNFKILLKKIINTYIRTI